MANTMKTYGSGSYTFAIQAKFGGTYGTISEQSAPFEYVAPAKPITSVQISSAEVPTDGVAASFDFKAALGFGYKATKTTWAVANTLPTTVDAMAGLTYSDAPFNFEKDKFYVVAVNVAADDGYKFEDNATATVNSNSAKLVKVDDNNAVVYCAFTTKPAIVTGIRVDSAPSKTTYKFGKDVSTDGLKVTAVYSNGSEVDVSSAVNVKDYDTTSVGDNLATVVYTAGNGTFTATFNYTVEYTFWQKIVNFFRNLFN